MRQAYIAVVGVGGRVCIAVAAGLVELACIVVAFEDWAYTVAGGARAQARELVLRSRNPERGIESDHPASNIKV